MNINLNPPTAVGSVPSGRRLRTFHRVRMNRIALVLIICLWAGNRVSGQNAVVFSDKGLDSAYTRSKAEHKLIFYMCYATWCPHCANMKANVFTDTAVAHFYNRNFICVSQDMETGEGIIMHDRFQVKSYPTFIFLDSAGNTLYRIVGEYKAAGIIQEGKNALDPKKQLPYEKQQFESDVSNSDNCYTYLRALKTAGMDYTAVVRQYFATQSDQQLLSEMNWRIIAMGETDMASHDFQFVLAHRKEYDSIASPERVQTKMYFIARNQLWPFVSAADSIHYFYYRPIAASMHVHKVDSLLFRFDLTLFGNMYDWARLEEVTRLYTDTFAWEDYSALRDIAQMYLDHVTDTAALRNAIRWTQRSLQLHEESKTYLLCARLYLKLDDSTHALEMADKARTFQLSHGWDPTEADKVIQDIKAKGR